MVRKFDFTIRFCEILKGELNQLGYSLDQNYDLGKKLPSTDIIKAPVDFAIETRDKLFLIEIEMHRADPSNNIAKIAYCLEQLRKEAIIIQWFSPYYKKRTNDSDKAKKVLAEYLGKKLLGERYHPIECDIDRPSFEELYKKSEKGKKLDTKEIDEIVKDTFKQIRDIIST